MISPPCSTDAFPHDQEGIVIMFTYPALIGFDDGLRPLECLIKISIHGFTHSPL